MIVFDGPETDGVVQHADRWAEAASNVPVSAHRHQAAADVAIRPRDWQDRAQQDLRCVSDGILAQLRPADDPPVPGGDRARLGCELNRLLSRTPDGVTLIAEPPPDRNGGRIPSLAILRHVVVSLRQRLPSDGVKLKLAPDAARFPRRHRCGAVPRDAGAGSAP